MAQSNVTYNLAIAGVAVLSLIAVGCQFFAKDDVGYTGDKVIVQSKTVEIPKDTEDRFKDFTGLLLVDKDGRVSAITPSGKPIDLCGGKYGPNCEIVLTADTIVQYLRAVPRAPDEGRCFALGFLRTCHISTQKYPYHTGTNHGSCQCSN